MSEQQDIVTVVIRDSDECRLGTSLDSDTATTLIAVASEDPSSWNEMVAYWPRYRTPVVCEFMDGLLMQAVDPEVAFGAIRPGDAWVAIDLVLQRIVTGGGFQEIGRDAMFAMVVTEDGRQLCPLSVHLPPWWELHEQSDIEMISRARQAPVQRPEVNREVLFGEPLVAGLASRVLEIVQSERWDSRSDNGGQSRQAFTIEVHRDWLMTPREDLGGLMPRQMLLAARNWVDLLVWAQQLRCQDGTSVVAVPDDVVGYETAPMGTEEIVLYFDLCRDLIAAAWCWCETAEARHRLGDGEDCRPFLAEYLSNFRAEWLASPYEGGSPPSFIIECSRRRVPRGAGLPIVGMSEREVEQHCVDPDCPVCEMMADGSLGVAFAGLDGHHLELEDEFAFSMHETREEWEQQQRKSEELAADIERRRVERDEAQESEPDEFASVWSGHVSDEPIPGDKGGHLRLAFLLTEIVSTLRSLGAPQVDIRQLNAKFTDFRSCGAAERAESGRRLGDHLETLAQRYSELVSRVADLRSRIDECVGSLAIEDDTEFPF